MSLRYLLDTSIISLPIAPKPSTKVLAALVARRGECAIASPVWHELLYGCRRLPKGKRRAAVEAYLDTVVARSFPILSYDETAAAIHATERARLEKRGRTAPFVDGQIAAIALANGLILVTTNTKDFKPYKDIVVEDWTK